MAAGLAASRWTFADLLASVPNRPQARALTKEQRQAIGPKAAAARWGRRCKRTT